MSELEEHRDEIKEKFKLSDEKYNELMAILLSRIQLEPKENISKFLIKALEFSPDKDDSPFLALALAKGIPLWYKPLKEKQSVVRVISTSELFETMK
jgi:predicted nucleic acid-binding protein